MRGYTNARDGEQLGQVCIRRRRNERDGSLLPKHSPTTTYHAPLLPAGDHQSDARMQVWTRELSDLSSNRFLAASLRNVRREISQAFDQAQSTGSHSAGACQTPVAIAPGTELQREQSERGKSRPPSQRCDEIPLQSNEAHNALPCSAALDLDYRVIHTKARSGHEVGRALCHTVKRNRRKCFRNVEGKLDPCEKN